MQKYFIKANEWTLAVSMYEEYDMMDEAFMVCRKYGDTNIYQLMIVIKQ